MQNTAAVEVTFPEQLIHALKMDKETFQKEVLFFTLAKFYEQGKISAGLASNVLGCDRWEFYRLLSENGFYVIDYSDDELQEERS